MTCTNSSRKLHDNCKMNEQRLTGQHNEDEITSDLKTKRLIIEENIALKRENSHLKDNCVPKICLKNKYRQNPIYQNKLQKQPKNV